jgi:hypothetical protein
MSVVPRCQTDRMPRKEKVISTRICGETSCNQILARFLLVKSPTKGLNGLKIPFCEVTPIGAIYGRNSGDEPVALVVKTSGTMPRAAADLLRS